MPSLRLFKTHQITFSRHGTTSKAKVNRDGEVEAASGVELIITEGSLQPVNKGQARANLPEGARTQDYRVYFSKAELRTTEQFQNEVPDTCTIDGNGFKVLKKSPWTGFGLRADNNEYYLELIQPKGS